MPEQIKKKKNTKELLEKLKAKSDKVKAKCEKNNEKESDLKSTIIKAIEEKKGEEIVVIDFHKITNSICDYFIICQGNSGRQINTIADSIEEKVRKKLAIKPSHKEGFANLQWVLLDYLDIVVHIFQPETRNFYQLEELWADANQLRIRNNLKL